MQAQPQSILAARIPSPPSLPPTLATPPLKTHIAPHPASSLAETTGLAHDAGNLLAALGRVGLMLNVRKPDLAAVLGLLPALKNPTVAPLADGEWVAVNTIIEEQTAWSLIPKLKLANAQGIVEYPLNKVVM